MSLSDQAVEVLCSLWDEQDDSFLYAYRDLLGSWREYALAHPDEVIKNGLPWASPLRQLIEGGVLSGSKDMLSFFAAEAGLNGGTAAIMHTIADHYAAHTPQIAGDLDGYIAQGAKNAVQIALSAGMSERDAAGLMMQKYAQLGSSRLRTIARTELTNGATLARIGAQAAAGRTTFEYRSILDDVTTRTCTHLNHMVLDMLDPLARELMPANHYRCRALVVPAETGVRPATTPFLRGALAIRAQEFPGWQSRLAPTITQLMGVG